MYSRTIPFDGEDINEALRLVADSAVNKRPPVPSSMPAEVASLMKDCWDGQPQTRPTCKEIDNRIRRFNVTNVEPGIVAARTPRARRTSMRSLELKKSNDLLHEVFPPHVAEALRNGRRAEPDHFDCVTLFFSGTCRVVRCLFFLML